MLHRLIELTAYGMCVQNDVRLICEAQPLLYIMLGYTLLAISIIIHISFCGILTIINTLLGIC